jgi:hypothetical protein
MPFDHLHHQMILRVLNALDPHLLERTRSYFGGGTLIALQHDEYRWSKDIDLQVRNPRQIIDGLDLLAQDLTLAPTRRTALEAGPEDEVSS